MGNFLPASNSAGFNVFWFSWKRQSCAFALKIWSDFVYFLEIHEKFDHFKLILFDWISQFCKHIQCTETFFWCSTLAKGVIYLFETHLKVVTTGEIYVTTFKLVYCLTNHIWAYVFSKSRPRGSDRVCSPKNRTFYYQIFTFHSYLKFYHCRPSC